VNNLTNKRINKSTIKRMKKLPIGIQTFSEVIEKEYLYVDKTGLVVDLVNDYKYVFLSRPRRFGKSMLCSTLQSLYEGDRDLFVGLEAENRWDWDQKFPVIKVEFGGVRSVGELKTSINRIVQKTNKKYSLNLDENSEPSVVLGDLILKLNSKFKKKVVILIDEYDKPILDNLDQIEVATEIRETLKSFYTQIKQNDPYIEFCFLTGVSKFSKVSLFSGLNNLTDISLEPEYGSICGYTQTELESEFKEYLEGVDLSEVKKWYNGYNFMGDLVYNPYDILHFLKKGKLFKNYWFETGTPSFLLKLIKQNNYFVPDLTNIEADDGLLNSFDIENIKLETILFQAGYLTIENVKQKRQRFVYKLKFPNLEVRNSFNDCILDSYVDVKLKNPIADDIYDVLEESNLAKLEDILHRLFSSISHHNYTKNQIANYEGFYASVVYTYLSALGLDVIAEDVTNKGRIDLTLQFEEKTYLFEFKVLDEDPLSQMKKMKYYEKYSGDVYLIGIKFNPKDRNMEEFVWEKVEG
jgi:hypothetical protein